MAKRRLRSERDDGVKVRQGFIVPIQALQAEPQGIAGTDILRRKLDRALQVPACVLKPSFAFQLQRGHIEQQRMLQPGTQCGKRGGGRPGQIASRSLPMNLEESYAADGRVDRTAQQSSSLQGRWT